jgi:hypothetical protein
MSKLVRLLAAALSTSLVLFALVVPAAFAAGVGGATPASEPGWGPCGHPLYTHCHTPPECFGNYQVIRYWDWYPSKFDHLDYTGIQCV